jgi:predicted  nucleic acid-binding Zn-ribbon protein
MPLREGLEQRISTLEAEKARDASLLLEAREAYAHLQQQLQATAAAAEAAQAELAFLAPLKEYAGDLQARLKTATASVEGTRAAAEAAKRRAAVAEHECNTQSSRAEAAEARATSLQAQYDELHHDSKNLSDLKQRLEKSFSEERASLAEALRASCGKVDQLEAEVIQH